MKRPLPPVASASRSWSAGSASRPAPRDAAESGAESVLVWMFGRRVVNDGSGMIKLDVPAMVGRDAHVGLTVEVNWPMILANAVARLYVVADANPEPLLARVLLIPDIVPPHVCVNVRLNESGFVRAVVECGDGALLSVKRWVWVTPSEV